MRRHSYLCAVLVGACTLDNGVGNVDKDHQGGGDTADSAVDSADSGGSGDSSHSGESGAACGDQSFPGGTLDVRTACAVPVTTPAWELVERWERTDLPAMFSTPLPGRYADTNGDGLVDGSDAPVVIAAPYYGTINAYRGDDGSTVWSVPSEGIEQATPAIADIDGDGQPEIFVPGLASSVTVEGADGATRWVGPAPSGAKAMCGAAGVADLDADGAPEFYFGRQILDANTGSLRGEGVYGNGTGRGGESPMTIAADLDGDGRQEVIAGDRAYNSRGDVVWESHDRKDGFVAVADMTGDGLPDVLQLSGSYLHLYDRDGDQIWKVYPVLSTYLGPPAIADLDGDGSPEIVVAGYNVVVALRSDGSTYWMAPIPPAATWIDAAGVSAYDLDGDGAWEVLVNTASDLEILDGATGSLRAAFPHIPGTPCGQYPTVSDLDEDGHVDILFGVFGGEDGDLSQGAVYAVSDSAGFVPGLTTWNQHGYSVTNINEDASLPAYTPNWEAYNNFRAGPPVEAVSPSKNPLVRIDDVCTEECASGVIDVWYQLGNDGAEAVTQDIEVQFFGVGDAGPVLLATVPWTADLPPGALSPSGVVTLTGAPDPLYDVQAVIQGGTECDAADDVASWGEVICE